MNPLKKKMLLAPILAVTLAFLLAGSVSFLPQNISQGSPTPQPSSSPSSTRVPIPTSQDMNVEVSDGNLFSVLFAIAATAVGVIIAWLLFSERSLKKEFSE
jgi:hypothetical protein